MKEKSGNDHICSRPLPMPAAATRGPVQLLALRATLTVQHDKAPIFPHLCNGLQCISPPCTLSTKPGMCCQPGDKGSRESLPCSLSRGQLSGGGFQLPSAIWKSILLLGAEKPTQTSLESRCGGTEKQGRCTRGLFPQSQHQRQALGSWVFPSHLSFWLSGFKNRNLTHPT